MTRKFPFLAASLLALMGCVPELDLDKYNDGLTYQGEWGIPLVNASVNLEDVLVNDTLFTVDPDGGLRIIYESDSLAGFSIDDFAEVPSQDPFTTAVPLDVPSLSVSTSLGTLGGAKFKQIRIRDGVLFFEVNNPLSSNVELRVTINNADIGGQTFQIDITATPGVSSSSTSVAGLDIDLTNNNSTVNYLSFDIAVINNGGASPGETVDLTMRYEDLLFGRAVGYFGQRSVNIPAGTFQLGVEAFENFLEGLYLDNPTIELSLVSNVGLPLGLSVDMDGINSSGTLESLDLDPISINGPSTIGQYDTTKVVIDNMTSNIVDFIANVPNTVLYSGQGIMNPQGETGVDNFITADGEMELGLRIDLPLELRTQDLIFQQRLNIDGWSGNQEQEYVKEMTIKFEVENEFPFDADMKLVFFNSSGIKTDSISLDLFDAAPVDGNGRSTGYRTTFDEVTLTDVQIERLMNSTDLNMIITMNTTNGGTTTVKLYEDYDIRVKIGADVKLDYDL